MIQIYRAAELPADVPAMIVSDGCETAVLMNSALLDARGGPWMRSVINALFDASAVPLAATA